MTDLSTTVPTAGASRYLQQLCKHFGHKTDAEFTAYSGWIKFGFGRAELLAVPGGHTMKALAENEDSPSTLRHVSASHPESFALREES